MNIRGLKFIGLGKTANESLFWKMINLNNLKHLKKGLK